MLIAALAFHVPLCPRRSPLVSCRVLASIRQCSQLMQENVHRRLELGHDRWYIPYNDLFFRVE